MSDAVALMVVMFMICLLVYIGVTIYNRHHLGAAQIARMPWVLEEHGIRDSEYWQLWASRPGTSEYRCLGQVSWDDPNFDEKVEEVRINGNTRLHTLNRGLPKS